MKISKKDLKKIINEEIDKFKKNEENLEEGWFSRLWGGSEEDWQEEAERTKEDPTSDNYRPPQDPTFDFYSKFGREAIKDMSEEEMDAYIAASEKIRADKEDYERGPSVGREKTIVYTDVERFLEKISKDLVSVYSLMPTDTDSPRDTEDVELATQRLKQVIRDIMNMSSDMKPARSEYNTPASDDFNKMKRFDRGLRRQRMAGSYPGYGEYGKQISENQKFENLVRKQVKKILGK